MVDVNVFKCLNKNSPEYFNDILSLSEGPQNTRNAFMKLNQPYSRTNFAQKSFSYLGPKSWNQLPTDIKKKETVHSFNHSLKKHFFKEKEAEELSIFVS